jgi:hypothetical protein
MKNKITQEQILEEFELLDILYRKILKAEAAKRLIAFGYAPPSIETSDINEELEEIYHEYGHFDNAIQRVVEACQINQE